MAELDVNFFEVLRNKTTYKSQFSPDLEVVEKIPSMSFNLKYVNTVCNPV